MSRGHVLTLSAIGAAALVVAFVLLPALQGRPLIVAVALGPTGLAVLATALGALMPPKARSALGWMILVACPLSMLVWVFSMGIPPGFGAIVLGGAVCVMAVAGLVLAVREVTV